MTNVFFVGDELAAGHGDPKALGWTGRVAARTLPYKPELRFHTLAVPGETTGELTARWDDEALRRLGEGGVGATSNAVLFAVGRHDVVRGVSPTMTRLNIANALDRAKALGFRTMVAGPPPGLARAQRLDRRALGPVRGVGRSPRRALCRHVRPAGSARAVVGRHHDGRRRPARARPDMA